jgi:hypothetical protein
MKAKTLLYLLTVSAVCLSLSAVHAESNPMSTFMVDTTAMKPDINPGNGICADTDGKCGLIAAMQEANAYAGSDVINVPAGTYTLPGRLEPTEAVTITGAGKTQTIIDGSGAGDQPAFQIKANVTLNQLAIRGFSQAVVIASGQTNRTLVLSSVAIVENGNELAEVGPAITNNSATSSIQISDSAISNNVSDACGAILNYGSLTITSSTINGNTATSSYGGAVCSHGVGNSLQMSNSLVYGNSAMDPENGYGGAFDIRSGTYTISLSEIFGNSAGYGGGAINISFGSISIDLSKIYGNSAHYGGGLSLSADTQSITHSLIRDNHAVYGGGLYIWKNATLVNCSIVENSSTKHGGGAYIFANRLSLINTTVSSNVSDQDGGGAYIKSNAVLELANVTLSNNTSDNNLTDGILALGGGFYAEEDALLQAKNSVVAGNIDRRANSFEIIASDCYGSLVSSGFNLIGYTGAFCSLSGDMAGMQYGTGGLVIDPNLGPLTAYVDALNYYHPVLFGPLTDRGDPSGCKDFEGHLLTSDQLQENPRPYQGGSVPGYVPRCDLGAIESFKARLDLYLPMALR